MDKIKKVILKDVIISSRSGVSRKLSTEDIGYYVVRSGNIQNGKFVKNPQKFWHKIDDKGTDLTKYILEEGDILVNFINSLAQIGKTAIFKDIGRECIFTTNIFQLKLKDNISDKYFLYYSMSEGYNNFISSITKPAVNQASFTRKNFSELPIPLPTLTEQQRIVKKLDDLFIKIDKVTGLLEKNIAHIQALMGSVLDKELSRFKTKTLKINDVLNEINSGFACNKSNEIPNGHVHLRTHNIDTSGNLNFDLMVKINPVKVDKKKNQIKKGDILFNNTNSKELVGKTALVDKDYNYGYSNHLTRIRLDEDLILPEFFVNYMINLHSQGYFLQICKKWIGQAGVNTGMIKDTEIKFPSIENQIVLNKKIDSIKESCTQIINQKTQKLNHLKALKSSLLDQAFKGDL